MYPSNPPKPKPAVDLEMVVARLDRILELLEPKADGPVEGLGLVIELIAPKDRHPKITKSDLPEAKPYKPKP